MSAAPAHHARWFSCMYAVALLAGFLQHRYVCCRTLPCATVVPRSGDLQRAQQASAPSFPASTHGEAQPNQAIWAIPATIYQVVLVFRATALCSPATRIRSVVTPDVNFRHRCSSAASADADVTLTSLQAELVAAVSAEDYQRAATLRDEVM